MQFKSIHFVQLAHNSCTTEAHNHDQGSSVKELRVLNPQPDTGAAMDTACSQHSY